MRTVRRLLRLAALTGFLAHNAAIAAQPPQANPTSGLVVVQFASGTTSLERTEAVAAGGLEIVSAMPRSQFVLATATTPGRPTVGGLIVDIRPPVVMRAAATPNDPAYPSQWHLPAVQAPQAWDLATGAGIVVAVVDTGVARSAPDLAGTSFAAGHDWVDDDASPDDENGHGTHVTGTVAQTTGNGIGAAGLAYGSTIMPLRALDDDGAGLDYDIALAIRFAVDRGATVINLSLGATSDSPVLREAVVYASINGVTMVASAGNDAASQVAYPAAYDEVIAVGAVRIDGTTPAYSNSGPRLDLVAPGGDSTVDQNGDGYGDGVLQQTFLDRQVGRWCYCFYQGTSMAAPHVSAAAALLASIGVTDPVAIRTALLSTARDLGAAGRDDEYGAGLLQVFDALQIAEPTPGGGTETTPPATPPAPTPEPVSASIEPHDIDDACPEQHVPRGQFADVESTSPHGRAIDCAAWLGITTGTSEESYRPSDRVNRAQMASFLARLAEQAGFALSQAPPDAFTDDDGTVHEHRINQIAAAGVARGGLDRIYAPLGGVTRAAMASFLVRTFDVLSTDNLPSAADHFDDDNGNTHEEAIDRVAAPGLATGTSIRTYSPGLVLTRAQMATFLMRTLDALIDREQAPRPA